MALSVIGLFAFGMIDPAAFAARMTVLAAIPEPLWWLLGAVVSFYFGAREMYYARIPTHRRKDQHADGGNLAKAAVAQIPRLRNGAPIKARASPWPLGQTGAGAGAWP